MTKAVKKYVGYLSDHIAQKVICHLSEMYVSLIYVILNFYFYVCSLKTAYGR